MKIDTGGRTFAVWLYTVGHRVLLLRSTKDAQQATRFDIAFFDVRSLHINTDMVLLEIEGDIDSLDAGAAHQRFLLRTNKGIFHVTAGSCSWVEDQGDYDAPSKLLL